MDLAISEGIDRSFIQEALSMHYEVFAKKFRLGIKNEDEFVRVFEDLVEPAHCLTATVNGSLAGILTYRIEELQFFNYNFQHALEKLPIIRNMLLLLNLVLLESPVGSDELYIDSIVTSAQHRSMGVGSALLREIEKTTRSFGKNKLVLEVIGSNPRAKSLYERRGFKTVSSDAGFWIRLATGSNEVFRMVKHVGKANE